MILELFENDLNSSEHKNKKRKSSVEVTNVYNGEFIKFQYFFTVSPLFFLRNFCYS